MKLATAQKLASFNAVTLSDIVSVDYNNVTIELILNVDVRERDVCYTVRFEDDGSFEGAEPVGNIYVREVDGKIQADF